MAGSRTGGRRAPRGAALPGCLWGFIPASSLSQGTRGAERSLGSLPALLPLCVACPFAAPRVAHLLQQGKSLGWLPPLTFPLEMVGNWCEVSRTAEPALCNAHPPPALFSFIAQCYLKVPAAVCLASQHLPASRLLPTHLPPAPGGRGLWCAAPLSVG